MNILRLASLLFLWLSYAAAEIVTLAEELLGVTPAQPAELDSITSILYTDTVDNYTSVPVGDAADLVNNINSSKPTVIYVLGMMESSSSTSAETIIEAYLERGDQTVIVIDWDEYAQQPPFLTAVSYVEIIGKTAATALDEMVAAGLNSSTIHIIGYSLGGHIAGFIGKYVNFTIRRITALDPPGLSGEDFEVNSNDADFVDIIHTDAGHYGTTTARGTVNFFPNGGTRIQPGCPILFLPFSDGDFCSHRRSYYYYAESLTNPEAFYAIKCNPSVTYESSLCSGSDLAVMGYNTPTNISGEYYLQTSPKSPYGMGEAGATYEIP